MAVTPICSNADLEARYGTTNVDLWADLDADASTVKIAARKLLARERATSYIYDILRQSNLGFALPLTTVPDTLEDACVKIAGYWLSTARGVTSYDRRNGKPQTRYYADYQDAVQTVRDVTEGKLKLDIDT